MSFNLINPAIGAQLAGSAKTPSVEAKRLYASIIFSSDTISIVPFDSSRAASACFQLAGLPILIAVAIVCGQSILQPLTIAAEPSAWIPIILGNFVDFLRL